MAQHLDARVGAQFLVLDDLIKGGFDNVTRVNDLPGNAPERALGPGINWEAYIKFHLQKAKEAMEALTAQERQQILITPEDADAPEPTESEGMDVIFGGDQEHVEISSGHEASS